MEYYGQSNIDLMIFSYWSMRIKHYVHVAIPEHQVHLIAHRERRRIFMNELTFHVSFRLSPVTIRHPVTRRVHSVR